MKTINEQKQKLVEEINVLLEQEQGSLIPILRKAIRLASLCDKLEYQMLFELHLDGISSDSGMRVQKWPDNNVTPKWNFPKAFQDDRTQDNQIQASSIKRLEEIVTGLKEHRGAASSKADAVKSMTIELSISQILTRIRNRVGNFVLQVESSLKDDSANTESIVENGYSTKQKSIFIGHGGSNLWKDLKDFLYDRLGLSWDEFNRESVAGKSTKERLEQMLDNACFAFLVMTAEDEYADQTMHARENVVHEIGLFQGRLGFSKSIVLLEEGCAEFSNIHGLIQIRFPKGNIIAKSEEIRRVLEREGMLSRVGCALR